MLCPAARRQSGSPAGSAPEASPLPGFSLKISAGSSWLVAEAPSSRPPHLPGCRTPALSRSFDLPDTSGFPSSGLSCSFPSQPSPFPLSSLPRAPRPEQDTPGAASGTFTALSRREPEVACGHRFA